jgi:DNA-binding MarR family transcriptional regulator
VDALDLIVLGRTLSRIGEEALRDGSVGSPPTGPVLVMKDVIKHPNSAISDITARTGLPQSYVSSSVAGLRQKGMVETSTDPDDGRRTLVRPDPDHMRLVAKKAAVPADDALARALSHMDADEAHQVTAVLSGLVRALNPSGSHPLRGR